MEVKYSADIDKASEGHHHDVNPMFSILPFTAHDFGDMLAYKDYYTERSNFDMYLLFIGIEGVGHIKYRGAEMKIMPGEIAMIYCMEPHYYATDPESKFWHFKWIHINGTAVSEYFSMINGKKFHVLKNNKTAQYLSARIDEIKEFIVKGDRKRDLLISNIISDMLTKIIAECELELVSGPRHSRSADIENVIEYINKNITQTINIDTLTKIACMSRYHFFRTFKAQTGKSPYEYVQHKKLLEVMKLIRTENSTILEISQKVKYSNINNMIKDFKKLVGVTPNQYRKSVVIPDKPQNEEK